MQTRTIFVDHSFECIPNYAGVCAGDAYLNTKNAPDEPTRSEMKLLRIAWSKVLASNPGRGGHSVNFSLLRCFTKAVLFEASGKLIMTLL